MKMSSPIYLAVLIVMVAYCKSDIIKPKDPEPRRCFQCSEKSSCGPPAPPDTTTCPPERPYCATTAAAPNYTSTLTCATGGNKPCSLTYSPKLTLTCVCDGHLCNAAFSKELQQELITFSSLDIPNNRTDYIDIFWKHSRLINDNDAHVYKKITMQATETPNNNAPEMITVSTSAPAPVEVAAAQAPGQGAGPYGQHSGVGIDPRAEMLRQETTVPSDDDEDESEGSGSDDDTLGLRRTSPAAADDAAAAAAPASPSAFLPTDYSDATRPFLDLIVTLPAFYYMLV
ncbi:hypothetical protein NE865_02053 [Phthorimaea operculella]|nr:hypothetical protein NE865_02053 [Phthorimaea operculella]